MSKSFRITRRGKFVHRQGHRRAVVFSRQQPYRYRTFLRYAERSWPLGGISRRVSRGDIRLLDALKPRLASRRWIGVFGRAGSHDKLYCFAKNVFITQKYWQVFEFAQHKKPFLASVAGLNAALISALMNVFLEFVTCRIESRLLDRCYTAYESHIDIHYGSRYISYRRNSAGHVILSSTTSLSSIIAEPIDYRKNDMSRVSTAR